MKAHRQSKKSGAITQRQQRMARLRAGQCVACGKPSAALDVGVAVVKPQGGTCGRCRFLAMQDGAER